MTLIIVVFIVFSLAGSIMWVLPSKRDRDRMELRLQARKLGLKVKLTTVDLPDKWDKVTENHKVAAYSHYREKPLESLPKSIWLLPYEVWKYPNVVDGWWSNIDLELDQSVKAILLEQGGLIKAINIAPESVSFYWVESGDEEDLTKLAYLIDTLTRMNFL